MSEDLENARDLPRPTGKPDEPGEEPPDLSETLEKIPPHGRISTERVFGATMSVGNPLHQKITGEHISELISLKRETTRQGYADRRETRENTSSHRGCLPIGVCRFRRPVGHPGAK